MFTYIIQPKENSSITPYVLAFSITDDTITGYVRPINMLERLPYIGRFFETNFTSVNRYFTYCVDNKYNADRTNTNHIVKSIHRDDPEHNSVHSDDSEISVSHYHLKHQKKIDLVTLRNFLHALKACEELDASKLFFTTAVQKDIIKKYQEYKEQHRSSLNYTTSNSVYYKSLMKEKGSMPTIGDHALCLTASPNAIGCTPDNIYTPKQFLPVNNATNVALDNNSIVPYVMGAAVIGMVGLFAQSYLAKKTKPEVKMIKGPHGKVIRR